jgi:iron complex outermembrane receptor protein
MLAAPRLSRDTRRADAIRRGAGGLASVSVRSRIARTLKRILLTAAMVLLMSVPARSQDTTPDLADKSIEDLMNIEVTSVSKTQQKISRTASAIFVITAEDISRSNALNIPDLLRMVPGIDVAQINANTWAITARGRNGRFSNQLLVMLDGRSVYSNTINGVFWDVLDLPLEDVERIEVIRGPGSSVWAANAVSGVINIITKKASDTSGALVAAGGGNVDQGFGTLQYGGKLGQETTFRAFAKYFNQDHFPSFTGQDGGDGWNLARIGFRTDSVFSSSDTVMFAGDYYHGREGSPTFSIPSAVMPRIPGAEDYVDLAGGYFQSVWDHTLSTTSGTNLQLSYDGYKRKDALGETRGTFDVSFQHHFAWGERQNLNWGVEYRFSSSRTAGNLAISLNPPNVNSQLFSSFIQDEIVLVPDRLFLTVGTKIERSYYNGWNAQPSVRVAWTPTARQTLWAAISKAERVPAEVDHSFDSNLGGFTGPDGPVAVVLFGNPNFANEKTIAYEAGYRMSFAEKLSLDLAAFYNAQSHQQTVEPGAPFFAATPAPPHEVLPLIYGNLMHGESHGLELFANWKAAPRCTVSPGFAFEEIHMHLAPTSGDTTSVAASQGSTPVNSAQLRSHVALPHALSWDASLYFVDRLTDPIIPSYTRFDTGLTWQWNKKSSLSLVGQNLLKDHHEEFVDFTGSTTTTEIKRSAYVKFTWQF